MISAGEITYKNDKAIIILDQPSKDDNLKLNIEIDNDEFNPTEQKIHFKGQYIEESLKSSEDNKYESIEDIPIVDCEGCPKIEDKYLKGGRTLWIAKPEDTAEGKPHVFFFPLGKAEKEAKTDKDLKKLVPVYNDRIFGKIQSLFHDFTYSESPTFGESLLGSKGEKKMQLGRSEHPVYVNSNLDKAYKIHIFEKNYFFDNKCPAGPIPPWAHAVPTKLTNAELLRIFHAGNLGNNDFCLNDFSTKLYLRSDLPQIDQIKAAINSSELISAERKEEIISAIEKALKTEMDAVTYMLIGAFGVVAFILVIIAGQAIGIRIQKKMHKENITEIKKARNGDSDATRFNRDNYMTKVDGENNLYIDDGRGIQEELYIGTQDSKKGTGLFADSAEGKEYESRKLIETIQEGKVEHFTRIVDGKEVGWECRQLEIGKLFSESGSWMNKIDVLFADIETFAKESKGLFLHIKESQALGDAEAKAGANKAELIAKHLLQLLDKPKSETFLHIHIDTATPEIWETKSGVMLLRRLVRIEIKNATRGIAKDLLTKLKNKVFTDKGLTIEDSAIDTIVNLSRTEVAGWKGAVMAFTETLINTIKHQIKIGKRDANAPITETEVLEYYAKKTGINVGEAKTISDFIKSADAEIHSQIKNLNLAKPSEMAKTVLEMSGIYAETYAVIEPYLDEGSIKDPLKAFTDICKRLDEIAPNDTKKIDAVKSSLKSIWDYHLDHNQKGKLIAKTLGSLKKVGIGFPEISTLSSDEVFNLVTRYAETVVVNVENAENGSKPSTPPSDDGKPTKPTEKSVSAVEEKLAGMTKGEKLELLIKLTNEFETSETKGNGNGETAERQMTKLETESKKASRIRGVNPDGTAIAENVADPITLAELKEMIKDVIMEKNPTVKTNRPSILDGMEGTVAVAGTMVGLEIAEHKGWITKDQRLAGDATMIGMMSYMNPYTPVHLMTIIPPFELSKIITMEMANATGVEELKTGKLGNKLLGIGGGFAGSAAIVKATGGAKVWNDVAVNIQNKVGSFAYNKVEPKVIETAKKGAEVVRRVTPAKVQQIVSNGVDVAKAHGTNLAQKAKPIIDSTRNNAGKVGAGLGATATATYAGASTLAGMEASAAFGASALGTGALVLGAGAVGVGTGLLINEGIEYASGGKTLGELIYDSDANQAILRWFAE